MSSGSVGFQHSVLLDSSGIVWTAGRGDEGQLGHGSTSSSDTPQPVQQLPPCAVVSASANYTACVSQDGELYCFGSNSFDELGQGDTKKKSFATPQKVGNLPPIKSVLCGYHFLVCIASDNTVWTWGDNEHGQLGLGDRLQRNTPCQVEGLTARQVACGSSHTLILTLGGELFVCGNDEHGQLGNDGASTCTPTLVSVPCEIASVHCGYNYSVIRDIEGRLWSTGDNSDGVLGLGDKSNRARFTQIPELVTTQVACGYWHIMAIDQQNCLWGCGNNALQQLSPSKELFAVSPTLLREDASVVLTGFRHTILLTTAGQVLASGFNFFGAMAIGGTCPSSDWAPSTFPADAIRIAGIETKRLKSARSCN